MVVGSAPLTFGNNPEAIYALGGSLDEIRLWDVARTPHHLQTKMATKVKATTFGLIGYWRLNEGQGQVARDRTGLGHRATLGTAATVETADPTWTTDAAPVS